MARGSTRAIVIWTERALVVLGVVLLAWAGTMWGRSAWYRHQQQSAIAVATPRADTSGPDRFGVDRFDRAKFAGLLEIPRIGLSEAFAEGDDTPTLDKAIGHLADTPLPWERGNSVFAGHRDQHFRPLKKVRIGDEIRLVTPRGTFRYLVTQTFIVSPQDVWVLAPTDGRELTLVTCYPFSYIGPAPKRFVVKAEPAREAVGQVALATAAR